MRLPILSGRECLKMPKTKFGGFESPSMFRAAFGNAKVAQRMLKDAKSVVEGAWKVFQGAGSMLEECFNVLAVCLKNV